MKEKKKKKKYTLFLWSTGHIFVVVAIFRSSPGEIKKCSLLVSWSERTRGLFLQAAQQTEVCWMAVLKDIPFSQFGTENSVQRAAGAMPKDDVDPALIK